MPLWAQWIVGVASVIIALGVTPRVFEILSDVAAEFRTNGGSSLRDVVNKLERASEENQRMTLALRRELVDARVLSVDDRMLAADDRALALDDRALAAHRTEIVDKVARASIGLRPGAAKTIRRDKRSRTNNPSRS